MNIATEGNRRNPATMAGNGMSDTTGRASPIMTAVSTMASAPRSGSRRRSRTGRGSRRRRDERRRQQRLEQQITDRVAAGEEKKEGDMGSLSVLLNYSTILETENESKIFDARCESDDGSYSISRDLRLDATDETEERIHLNDAVLSKLDNDSLSLDSFSDETRSSYQDDLLGSYNFGSDLHNLTDSSIGVTPVSEFTRTLQNNLYEEQAKVESYPEPVTIGRPLKEVSKVFQCFALDHHGFLDLVDDCFLEMERRIGNSFSHSEFRLCCGLLLYHRLLKIEHNLLGLRSDVANWFPDFERCLGANIVIPKQVSKYLNALGGVEDKHHNTFIPSIELPPSINRGCWDKRGPEGDSFLSMGILTAEIADQLQCLPSGTNFNISGNVRRSCLVGGIPAKKIPPQRRNALRHRITGPIVSGGHGWRSQLQWSQFTEETWADFQNMMRRMGNMTTQYNKHDYLCKGKESILILSMPHVDRDGEYESRAGVLLPYSGLSPEVVAYGRHIRALRYTPLKVTFNNNREHVDWSIKRRRNIVKRQFVYPDEAWFETTVPTVSSKPDNLAAYDYPNNFEILQRESALYNLHLSTTTSK